MHTDLSVHLHTQKCNELIKLLQQCHMDHPLRKFLGYCNSQDHQVTKCLKEERLRRRDLNREKSKAHKEKLRKAFEAERAQSKN